jgi:hypothetical protein
VLLQWAPKSSPKFENVPEMNLFNDNVDYIVSNFDQLCRLNTKLMEVARKFTWLDAKKAAPVLELFKTNLEIVQTLFGEIEGQARDFTSVGVDEILRKGEELEKQLLALSKEVEAWNLKNPSTLCPGPQRATTTWPARKKNSRLDDKRFVMEDRCCKNPMIGKMGCENCGTYYETRS